MARCPKQEDHESAILAPGSSKIDSNDTRLKVLCIHGYRQNGDLFRQKLGAFRKALKNKVRFYFVTAPHIVLPFDPNLDGPTNGEAHTLEHFCWWFSNEDMSFDPTYNTDMCVGFQKSWAQIAKMSREEGPFDGLLGFSQGACMVGVLCGMLQREWLEFKFNFAIMVAGFKSRSLPHRAHYSEMISIPSLHIYGETDKVISKEMSEELTKHFENPVILSHPGGHFVPASDKQRVVYNQFFEDRLQEKESSSTENEKDSSDSEKDSGSSDILL